MLMNPNTGGNTYTIEQLTPDIYFQIENLKQGEYSSPSVFATPDGNRGWRILPENADYPAQSKS